MDGIVVNYDPVSAKGVIRAGSKMYPFKRMDWQERRAPRKGDKVEFEAVNDSATQIYHQLEADRLPTALEKFTAKFDSGFIAGSYTIVFFLVIVDYALLNIVDIDANNLVTLFVILDLLTAVAWIRGTDYRIMRAIATVFALVLTGLAVFILLRHMVQGGG